MRLRVHVPQPAWQVANDRGAVNLRDELPDPHRADVAAAAAPGDDERARADVVHRRGEDEHPAPASRLDRDRTRKSLIEIRQALTGIVLGASGAARENDDGRKNSDGAHARVLHRAARLRSPFSGARRGEKLSYTVATRITYTSGVSDPELDARFEQALERARAGSGAPLRHVVAGTEREDGPVFERPNPSHADE